MGHIVGRTCVELFFLRRADPRLRNVPHGGAVRSVDARPSENQPNGVDRPSTEPPQTTPKAPPEPFQWPEAVALTCVLALVSLLLTGWVRPLDLWPW